MKKINWRLVLVVVLAFFLRFYKLGQSPAGFYLDEAAIGYNAWSISETGRDEFAKEWPIIFRSFTDFKTPIYSYLMVPLVKLMDLSVLSTRLISALAGLVTVMILYFLMMDLTGSKKISFWSGLLLTISPWHIMFSRTTYETNLALMFLVAGVWLFFKSFSKRWIIVPSIVAFVISSLAYHSERMVAPLMLLALFFRFRRHFIANLKSYWIYMLMAAVIGFVLAWPTLILSLTPGFTSRLKILNIFSNTRTPAGWIHDCSGGWCNVVNNRFLLLLREFLSLFVSYFSPRHLFNLGDYRPRNSYVDLSTFYVWQLPLYFLGLYYLFKKKGVDNKFKFVTGLFLVLGALPAAMTGDPYSTIRALPMVVGWVIIMAIALAKIPTKFNFVLGGLVLASVIRWYWSGMVLNDYFRAVDWELGIEESVEIIKAQDENLPVIVDSSRGEPYIQWLFFLEYDPASFQRQNFEVSEDEYYTNMHRNPVKNLGRITIRPIVWGKDTDYVEQYLVADELALSMDQINNHGMDLIKEVLYPDGSVAYRIAKTNPKNN